MPLSWQDQVDEGGTSRFLSLEILPLPDVVHGEA
jgi:hypothetical protein